MLATIDIPLIGEIASANKDFMLNPMQLKSPVAEQFRRLEFNLNSKLIDGRRAQTFLLTSHSRKEGKSFICFNLSRFFAALGSKTVLVECDLRRPRLARLMAVKTQYGVTDYVCCDQVPMGEIIYTIPSAENCWFIPAGQQIADPIETSAQRKDSSDVLLSQSAFRYHYR